MTLTNSRPAGPVLRLDPRELTASESSPVPWTREQLATLCLVDIAGAVVILFAAWQAHSRQTTSHAMAWLGVALLGLAISGSVHMLWVMRNRRVMSLAISAVTRAPVLARVAPASTPTPSLRSPRSMRVEAPATPAEAQAETTMTLPRLGSWVIVPGSDRYHRPDCAFVSGRPTLGVEGDLADKQACEVCEP